jgi:hypothetical protein
MLVSPIESVATALTPGEHRRTAIRHALPERDVQHDRASAEGLTVEFLLQAQSSVVCAH